MKGVVMTLCMRTGNIMRGTVDTICNLNTAMQHYDLPAR